jgi:hypothetical protein
MADTVKPRRWYANKKFIKQKKTVKLLFTLVINNSLSFPVLSNSESRNTNQCFFKVLLQSKLFIIQFFSTPVWKVLYLAVEDS